MPSAIVLLIADDVKLYIDISCNNSSLILHEAITSLRYWANEWLLEISYNKRQVLHLAAQHQRADYHRGHFVRRTTSCAKNSGFSLTSNWNLNHYIPTFTQVASQRSALIVRSFASRDRKLLIKAFCAYVRPILEYGSSILVTRIPIRYINWNLYRNISINAGTVSPILITLIVSSDPV